jgi:rod shape-determining protein MreB
MLQYGVFCGIIRYQKDRIFVMNKKIAIDIGTSSVLVYIKGKGLVLQEPTVIAVDNITNRVIKAGREAKEMTERTAENVATVFPVSAGVINRYTHTLVMLRKFLERSCGKFVVRPDITISVPCCISDVEEMAFRDIAKEVGAKNVYLVDAPFASAIGAGIDVLAPVGNMVIDIGGGKTDAAVISLGGIVESVSVKCGGNNFNEALIKYVKAKYGVSISDATAEEAKLKAGTVINEGLCDVVVKGKGERTPTPVSVTVTGRDILEAYEEPVTRIAEAVCSLLEKIPPELVSDIAKNGILMTGGGSLIRGIDKLVSSITGAPVRIAEKPISCTVIGAGKADEFDISAHTSRKKLI